MQAIFLPGKTQITAAKLGRIADLFGKDNDSHWNTSRHPLMYSAYSRQNYLS